MTKTTAMVWGSEAPAYSVGWCKPMWPGDSGYTVIFDDAPDPDDVAGPGHPGIALVHLGCLLDEHPELGHALDLARRFGAADLAENGEWVGRLPD